MTIDDPFERFFYEFECIKGTWSVRELRRQITTNLYVRAETVKKRSQEIDKSFPKLVLLVGNPPVTLAPV